MVQNFAKEKTLTIPRSRNYYDLLKKDIQCVSKKRLPFEIQISHNVLNLPDKYNCLESFSES